MNKLNSQIFLFLNELNANNNRDWFNKNKQVFQAHQNDIKEFSYQVQEHLNKEDDISGEIKNEIRAVKKNGGNIK